MFLNNLCQFWTYSVLRLCIWEHTFSETKLKGEIVAAQGPCRPAVTVPGASLCCTLSHVFWFWKFQTCRKVGKNSGVNTHFLSWESPVLCPRVPQLPPHVLHDFFLSHIPGFRQEPSTAYRHTPSLSLPGIWWSSSNSWSFVTYTFWRVGVISSTVTQFEFLIVSSWLGTS